MLWARLSTWGTHLPSTPDVSSANTVQHEGVHEAHDTLTHALRLLTLLRLMDRKYTEIGTWHMQSDKAITDVCALL